MKKYTCFLYVEYYISRFLIASNSSFLCSELKTAEGKLLKIIS